MKPPMVLMMALSLPSTAGALGLGDIHVDSALNEPLTAEIDIVGATEEDLAGLNASIANKETFARLNADRPSFLQSTTFKVAQNSRGLPVLAIRSTESFAEPLVNLVVDLRWHNGELIRQYSLLLDPASFPTAIRLVDAPHVTTTHMAAAEVIAAPRKLSQVKIGAKATLRGVAWRVGARSEADLQTLMYAIFLANPAAFEGNINRLHRGAVLNIPPAAQVAAISKADASREIHAQMAAWRGDSASSNKTASNKTASTKAASAISPPASAPIGGPIGDTAPATLNRLKLLESSLSAMQLQFEREHDRMLDLQAQLDYAQKKQAAPAAMQPATAPARRSFTDLIAAGLVLIGALGTYFYWQRRRRQRVWPHFTSKIEPAAEVMGEPIGEPVGKSIDAPVGESVAKPVVERIVVSVSESARRVHDSTDTLPTFASRILDDIDIASLESSYIEEAIGAGENIDATGKLEANDQTDVDLEAALADETVVNLENTIIEDTVNLHHESSTMPAATLVVPPTTMAPVAPVAEEVARDIDTPRDMNTTRLDYNLVDLDVTAQHVQMPSLLHEPAVLKERRKNLVDVLKMAIEREPDRRDLRMKLLETYYAAAAVNRQGFLDAVQKFARERDYLANGEWEKISFMGRQIAGDSALFAEPDDKEDLADCA